MWGGKNLMINHVQLFILLFWSCIVTSSLKELRVNFSRPNNTLTLLLFVFLILIILCPLYFVLIFYCSNFFLRKKKNMWPAKNSNCKGIWNSKYVFTKLQTIPKGRKETKKKLQSSCGRKIKSNNLSPKMVPEVIYSLPMHMPTCSLSSFLFSH